MDYNPTNIFTSSDLKNQISSKIINGDIIIRGEHLFKLEGVEKIFGFLGISDSSIDSLGQLNEITGDFWTSFHTVNSPLTSLDNLEKIGGNASFRFSNIIDLGNLQYVGGCLGLRDTKINNLGKLKYIGGDLFLPKRLEDKIDFSNIEIKGKIRFWNDNKNKIEIPTKSDLNLTKPDKIVPYWAQTYIFSNAELKSANTEQQNFYAYFKKCFLKNLFIDLSGNDNYSFILYYDLLSDYYINKNINKLEEQFKQLETHYPKTANYTSLSIIEEYEKRKDYESAWEHICKRQYISIDTIWKYQQKINTSLFNENLLNKLGGYNNLTEFGKKNIEQIKPFVKDFIIFFEKEKGANFFNIFFDKDYLLKDNNNSPDYYFKYFLSDAEYRYYKSIDEKENSTAIPNIIDYIKTKSFDLVENAILSQCRLIVKNAEDLYRESIGMPKIGEGWISETELYYKIVREFTEFEVIHHGKPKWLGRQHIDIYFPKLNIGLEYQGSQHFDAVDFFGGQEAFEKTKERDENKRQKCKDNNCILIYVEENYNFEMVIEEIKKAVESIFSSNGSVEFST